MDLKNGGGGGGGGIANGVRDVAEDSLSPVCFLSLFGLGWGGVESGGGTV